MANDSQTHDKDRKQSEEYNKILQNEQINKRKPGAVIQGSKLEKRESDIFVEMSKPDKHEPGIFVEMSKPDKHEPGIFVDMSESDKYEHTVFVEKSESNVSKSESKALKSESKALKSESKTLKSESKALKSESNTLKPEFQDVKKLSSVSPESKEDTKESPYFKDLEKHISNLGSTIEQLAVELKKSTDAKSWEALSQGNLDIRRYANYYDVSNTITTAGATNPNDFDSPVYNVERVFEYLERYAEIIYVTNDGTDNLFVIVSHGGRTVFSQEAPLYPGEIKCYFNVYEIRLRSPTVGLAYRVTEYCIYNISEISSIPIEKANLHNESLPAINANWLAANMIPTNTPTTFMIEVVVSVAGSFRAVVTKGGNSQTVTFNVVPGPALVAGGLYIFNLMVHSGDTVNFTYSTTGGIIQLLRVQELDSASA